MHLARSQLLFRLGVTSLALFFLASAAANAHEALTMDHSRSDMHMFYAGSKILLSSERQQLYDAETQVREVSKIRNTPLPDDASPNDWPYVWYRIYNPPLFLAATAPSTLLTPHGAYLLAIAVNLGILALLAVVLGFVLRWRQPQTFLLWLALPAVDPTYITLQHAQPTFLIAALIGLACLAIRNERHGGAGVLLAFTGVKPNWLLPAASLFRDRRLFLPFLATSLVFLALPFLVVGRSGIAGYFNLILDRGGTDVNNHELGLAVVGWSGFFQALTGQAQQELWLLASLVTVALFAVIWQRNNVYLTLAAAIPATLLVIPHEHSQDLVLLFASAAIILSLRWRSTALAGVCLCLMAQFVGANLWSSARAAAVAGERSVYWVSLACFATLTWLAVITVLERRKAGRESAPLPVGTPPWAWALDSRLVRGWHGRHGRVVMPR